MRLYRFLLHLYPASFRAEYGAELTAIFARRQREAGTAAARLVVWADALGDTIANAARAHADILGQDVRYAIRTLARTPGFAVAAVIVAALGIGATTATFSLADHVLLRPLPFAEPDRLVKLYQSFPNYSRTELSAANYADWKRMSTSFKGMAAFHTISMNLVGRDEPVRLDGVAVTSDFFQVMGVPAALGRVLASVDDRTDAPGAVVLSNDLWITAFGADPNIVGRTVTLVPSSPTRASAPSYTIIGVMPGSFRFPQRTAAFWIARRWVPEDFRNRDDHYIYAVARLKDDVTIDQARAELGAVAASLERLYPQDNAKSGATVMRLQDEIAPQTRLLLLALAGAAICMLLIACTNLASLLLTRALSRGRELAVRAAVGAGWHRLVRQMLTESGLLALIGGVAGIALALLILPVVARMVPTGLPIDETPTLDWRLLAVAAVATAITGIGFGLAPALRMSRGFDTEALREGARVGGGRHTERLRGALVVIEVAVCLVLLISAGLLIRALGTVQRTDPGFKAAGVLTLRTALPIPPYDRTARREQVYGRILADVRALPGVTDAGYISFLPFRMRGGIWSVKPAGAGEEAAGRAASLRFVTPGLFAAMGIPIRRGRDILESDSAQSAPVAVISESLARALWPDQDPLGRHVTVGVFDRMVVGVAGDISVRGLERTSEPQIYLASSQMPDGNVTAYAPKDLVVRSSVPPATLASAVRAVIRRAEPELPISDVETLSDVVDGETAARRVQVGVLGALAAVAILLAAVGVHGLLTFAVSARTREIGIRLALGAVPGQVLGTIVGRGISLGLLGVLIGVPLALGAARLMQALLAGVSPADPLTLAGATALCLLMTIAGTVMPAVRVLRIDPVTAIREE